MPRGRLKWENLKDDPRLWPTNKHVESLNFFQTSVELLDTSVFSVLGLS
jgi:hypothetical protein